MKLFKIVLCSLLLLVSLDLWAQKPVVVELWPSGAPNNNEVTGPERRITKNNFTGITKPTITVYPSSKANSKAIIICPGGGYSSEYDTYEGHDMHDWMNSIGITFVVLKYRLPNKHSEIPLTDVHKAIEIVRGHASEWNVNPEAVGIMGCSAGGHLAATAANFFTVENRPDFQVLLYPVITMDKKYTHGGTRHELIGDNPTDEVIKKYSMELQVSNQTPRAFIVLADNDYGVSTYNTINYYIALHEHHVSASIHIYPFGGHGFGNRDMFVFKRQWTDELEKWLSTF